jgi:threonyl-tRNA synthetase
VQVSVLTVTDRNIPYAETVVRTLMDNDIRAESDFRNEKLGLKIREAQLQKVPYMLVIGDQECEQAKVKPRARDGRNLPMMSTGEFIGLVKEDCKQRR